MLTINENQMQPKTESSTGEASQLYKYNKHFGCHLSA